MDHESEKTHLGGTALVQFNGTLLKLGFFIEGVPAEVDGSVTEVSREFTRGGTVGRVLHDGEFQETNKGKNLKGARDRHGEGGSPAGSKVRELGSISGDVSREVDTSLVDKVANNTKHADTSVLDFDITKAVELFLVSVSNKTKGIEESKRSLGTEGVFEGLQGGGGGGLLGGSESSGGGEERGKDGGLHFERLDDSFDIEIVKRWMSYQGGVGRRRYLFDIVQGTRSWTDDTSFGLQRTRIWADATPFWYRTTY